MGGPVRALIARQEQATSHTDSSQKTQNKKISSSSFS
jgi:hypothetical protein